MTIAMSSRSTTSYRKTPFHYRYTENIIPFISEKRYGRLSPTLMEPVWIAAIRRLMASKGWNQQELCKAARMRPNTVSDALNGTDPRISTLTKIAAGLGVPMWALFTDEAEYGIVKQQMDQAVSESADAKRQRELRAIVESVLPQLVEPLTGIIAKGIDDGTLAVPRTPKPQPVAHTGKKKIAG